MVDRRTASWRCQESPGLSQAGRGAENGAPQGAADFRPRKPSGARWAENRFTTIENHRKQFTMADCLLVCVLCRTSKFPSYLALSSVATNPETYEHRASSAPLGSINLAGTPRLQSGAMPPENLVQRVLPDFESTFVPEVGSCRSPRRRGGGRARTTLELRRSGGADAHGECHRPCDSHPSPS